MRRVIWCVAVAAGLTAIGALPWYLWSVVENGPGWAQSLFRGAAYFGLPMLVIGEVLTDIGWASVSSMIVTFVLTAALWFGIAYGLLAVARRVRRSRAHV